MISRGSARARQKAGALLLGAFSFFLIFNGVGPHVDGLITQDIEKSS
jgi:hypothetical protein